MENVLYVIGPVVGYPSAGSCCVSVNMNLTLSMKLPQALLQVREQYVFLRAPDCVRSCEKYSQSKVRSKDDFKERNAVKYCFCPCLLDSPPAVYRRHALAAWARGGHSCVAAGTHPARRSALELTTLPGERPQCPQASLPSGKSTLRWGLPVHSVSSAQCPDIGKPA